MLVGVGALNSISCGVDTSILTLACRHRALWKVLQDGAFYSINSRSFLFSGNRQIGRLAYQSLALQQDDKAAS
jgi:hypothetical protein